MEERIANMFVRPETAKDWIDRINLQLGKWVKLKGKSYWEFVRFYGFWRGITKELSRPDFTHLLVTECKDALDESDTEGSLKSNMDIFKYKDDLRKRTEEERKKQKYDTIWRFELLSDSHACCILKNELDDILSQPLPNSNASVPNMEQRLEVYLKQMADEYPYATVYSRPTYCFNSATFSIEQYMKPEFADQRKPSQIMVFECINEQVTENKVHELYSRYDDRRIKLFIASPYCFDIHTQGVARSKNVGLILVDPRFEVNDNCFIVERSTGITERSINACQMMSGLSPMNTQFVITDSYGYTTSLADVLNAHGINVKKQLSFVAPHWTNDYIEHRALELVKDKVELFVRQMQAYPLTRQIPHYDVSPLQLLQERGYRIEMRDLSCAIHLSSIDLKSKIVTFDSSQPSNSPRLIFSQGHELGHDELHGYLAIKTFGDSDFPLSPAAIIPQSEQKWLEHHANHFASCLLMPREVVGYLYAFFYQLYFNTYDIKPLYLSSQVSQYQDFLMVATPIAKHLNVSIEALKWRLVNLKLLIIS